MSDPATLALIAIGALALSVALLALVLRWSSVPGGRSAAAIVAGISIGLLAGPGVLGRGWPTWHERMFGGAEREVAAMGEMARRHRDELTALTATGVTGPAIEEHRARQAEELAPLVKQRDNARHSRRVSFDWAAQSAIALYLVMIGPAIVPRARRAAPITWSSDRRRDGWHGWNQWFGRSVGVGFAAVAMSCCIPALLGAWFLKLSPREAVAFAVIMGAPGIAATLRPRLSIASAVGLFACLSMAVLIGWSMGMTIVATGLCLGLMAGFGFENPRAARRVRRWGGFIGHAIALPTATALAAVQLDLHGLMAGSAWKFWCAIVIAILWSSDGRWLAWMLAIRWLSIARPWRDSAACVNAGVGVAQLGLTIVLSAASLADPSIVAAGLLGAAIVEITRGMREWMGAWLDGDAPV